MTSPTERLDEWTETAIRGVLTAGLGHGDFAKVSADDCAYCSKPMNDLRSRIRTLIKEAWKEGYRNAESSGEHIGI